MVFDEKYCLTKRQLVNLLGKVVDLKVGTIAVRGSFERRGIDFVFVSQGEFPELFTEITPLFDQEEIPFIPAQRVFCSKGEYSLSILDYSH